ncbi:MAG: UBP-type zinc finger domain-containing protein [Thermaceae bacterium]|nr:UBP-type zinc finger domain-containing protein [Thermaceae bacterium]
MANCTHLRALEANPPDLASDARGCEECLKMRDTWVHLRICLECGHVGCCDNSKNKHATRHFHESGHALIQSFEPGESWVWCYVDQQAAMFPDKLYHKK